MKKSVFRSISIALVLTFVLSSSAFAASSKAILTEFDLSAKSANIGMSKKVSYDCLNNINSVFSVYADVYYMADNATKFTKVANPLTVPGDYNSGIRTEARTGTWYLDLNPKGPLFGSKAVGNISF